MDCGNRYTDILTFTVFAQYKITQISSEVKFSLLQYKNLMQWNKPTQNSAISSKYRT